MEGKPQLLYFNVKGRDEAIRLLYHHAGVEFEDTRIADGEFPAMKANLNICPLGQVPVLKTPCGKTIVQTTTIIRYVAAQLNLYGNDNIERALIDSVIVSNKELHDAYIDILFRTPDALDKAQKRLDLDKQINLFFTYYERLVKETSGDFIVGDKISAADIYFIDLIEVIGKIFPNRNYFEKYPLLKIVFTKTQECGNIIKYLDSRK